jgi:hypothetical protein
MIDFDWPMRWRLSDCYFMIFIVQFFIRIIMDGEVENNLHTILNVVDNGKFGRGCC